MSAIFNVIRIPFVYLMKGLYALTSNYFVSIVLFSIILKLVMFPFGIKQQKNSQKQAKLRPKENVIRKKYAGRTDRATQLKMNTEIQELYQKENFSPLGGCLPMLISMLVLLSVYGVVRAPITYTAKMPTTENFHAETVADSVKKTVTYMVFREDVENGTMDTARISKFLTVSSEKGKYDEEKFWEAFNAGKFTLYAEINSIGYIRDNEEAFIQQFNGATHFDDDKKPVVFKAGDEIDGQKIVEHLPEMQLFNGFDIGLIPNTDVLKAKEIGTKLLILVPVLTLVTAYFGQALTRKFTYQPEQTPEMQSQTRMMNLFMPLFSLFISFTVPAAVGIYWMMSNILSPVQQIALSKMFPIKEISPEEMREAERLYGGKQKKKKGTASTGKKKKSLVYDDDDEEESTAPAPVKKTVKEKKDAPKNGAIEKAPLKEDK